MQGELPNVEIGQKFENRQACYGAEVHRHVRAGIAGYAGGKPDVYICLALSGTPRSSIELCVQTTRGIIA
jgi:hypothetical protein